MATLQKLRNAGPLLVIFVGLALFAFIAGDAWRLLQSNFTEYNAGSINGEELSVEEFQKMYQEYTNVMKVVRGNDKLTEDEMAEIKNYIWSSYVTNQLITEEAEKLGLTVTNEEIQAIVDAGANPLLQNTPFTGAQGKFDADILKNFLAQYEENKDNEQYRIFYDYWKFIERTIKEQTLADKYHALIQNSFIGNPIVAKSNFDANSYTYDIEVAAYPYSAIEDSTIELSSSDINKVYKAKKENFKQFEETRDIEYVSFHITPSNADRKELENEFAEWNKELEATEDYASIVRQAGSEVEYSDVAWAKSSYPEEVQVRLDSTAINSVVGPIYNQYDDSYTSFKLVAKNNIADSIQYRMLIVNSENAEKTTALADSLLAVLKSGADYKEVAKKYGQENSDSMWLASAHYSGNVLTSGDAEIIKNIINSKKGDYSIMNLKNSSAKIIYKILDSKNNIDVYNVAVVKIKNTISDDTHANAYNNFSQFVASCKDIDDMKTLAEENGFRVMRQNGVNASTHKIANISGTAQAHRWIMEAKEGEISPLYECGDNDYLLVAAVSAINEKGYTSLEVVRPMMEREAYKEKKAEKIMSEIKGKNLDEIKKIAKVKVCNTNRISFSAPAYISATSSSEPIISAIVSKLNVDEVSEPIKGSNGVYVIKLINKTKKASEFNAKAEEEKVKMQGTRGTYNFINELMNNADIEDNRYLYIQ